MSNEKASMDDPQTYTTTAASTEAPKLVLDSDLPENLNDKFQSLFDEIYELFSVNEDEQSIQEAAREMCEHIRQEVTEHPILARTVSKDVLGWSLLTTVCEKTYGRNVGHDAIKFLITMNPHALMWKGKHKRPIHIIAENSCHCVLLPWIVEHHAWIFEHPKLRRQPPHYELVSHYASGECSASVVRTFYELCPQALRQKN